MNFPFKKTEFQKKFTFYDFRAIDRCGSNIFVLLKTFLITYGSGYDCCNLSGAAPRISSQPLEREYQQYKCNISPLTE